MDCRSCRDDLTAYLDGELEPARVHQVEAHMQGCSSCRAELESLEKASRLVAAHLPEIEPGPDAWDRVAARIAADGAGRRQARILPFPKLRPWITAAAALAASLILGVGLWGIWQHRRSEDALHQYMNEYVQKRNTQEEVDHRPVAVVKSEPWTADASSSDVSDNPFVEVNAGETDNPFRSEAP